MDLQLAQLSEGCVSFLSQHMPVATGQGEGSGETGLDYERWLDEAFLED
jgi:hypothetical protein